MDDEYPLDIYQMVFTLFACIGLATVITIIIWLIFRL
jgi:hypothetical protein